MKCTIPGANMKVLARAIQALARIGDELYVEPDVDSLSFRSVNSSRSGYASFTFNRAFFSFYKYVPSEASQSSQQSSQGSSKCKISMKSCLPVFRSPVMLDRKVENCIMRLEDNDSKLIFEMRCHYGIVKTYFLPVIECGTLQVVYTRNHPSNCLIAPVQLFTDSVHNFLNTQEEVTLTITSQKTFIRSYVDGLMNASKMKHTEITLSSTEFNQYTVETESTVTFCLKEFRALLSFAEATNLDVEAYFGTGGKPINFSVKYDKTYEASFILSTLSPEIESRSLTPQQMRVPNSNSAPIISGESSAVTKDKIVQSNPPPSTSRQSQSNQVPSARTCTPEAPADLPLNTSQQPLRAPILRGESPSLLSSKKSGSDNNDTVNGLNHCELATSNRPSSEKRGTTSDGKGVNNPDKQPNSQSSVINKQTLNNNNNELHERTSNVNSISHPRTPVNALKEQHINNVNLGSPHQSPVSCNAETSELTMMSGVSSLSLQVRESDDDHIPSSPQPVRKRPRLFEYFECTLDPRTIPGHNIILIADSGDESS